MVYSQIMAEIITDPETEFRRYTRTTGKYPWDEWLDGQARHLHEGQDYANTTKSLRTVAYRIGKERGIRVRTRVTADGLLIQATGPI